MCRINGTMRFCASGRELRAGTGRKLLHGKRGVKKEAPRRERFHVVRCLDRRLVAIGTALSLGAVSLYADPSQAAAASDGLFVERQQLERLLMRDYAKRVHEATNDQLLALLDAVDAAPELSDSEKLREAGSGEKAFRRGGISEGVNLQRLQKEEGKGEMPLPFGDLFQKNEMGDGDSGTAGKVREDGIQGDMSAEERDLDLDPAEGENVDEPVGEGRLGNGGVREWDSEQSSPESSSDPRRVIPDAASFRLAVKKVWKASGEFVTSQTQRLGNVKISINYNRLRNAAKIALALGTLALVTLITRRALTATNTPPSSDDEEESDDETGFLRSSNSVPFSAPEENPDTSTPAPLSPEFPSPDGEPDLEELPTSTASTDSGTLWKRSSEETEAADVESLPEPAFKVEWGDDTPPEGTPPPPPPPEPPSNSYTPSKSFQELIQDPWKHRASTSLESLLERPVIEPSPSEIPPSRSSQHVFSNVDPLSVVPLDVLLQRL